MGAFACINNGPLKGQFSSAPEYCIDSSITHMLLSPYSIEISFRYGIDDVLDL